MVQNMNEDLNPYELLGVTLEASEAEIKTAYRQRSLKVHPDRHPNNPEAASKFHELNQAYELLLDPLRKTSLDASLRVKLARKERFAKFDSKRKGMQEELEEAERAVKRAKMDKLKQEREREEEADRIKEAGRRMRQEKQDELARKEEERKVKDTDAAGVSQLGPLDTTVRVKYPLSKYPTLTTPASLTALLSSFGTVDVPSIVISMKPPKKAPHKAPKFATALVTFGKIWEAHAAVCASGVAAKGLEDVEVSWAEGKEPSVLDMSKQKHQLDPEGQSQDSVTSASGQPFASTGSATGFGKQPPSSASSAPSFSFDPSEARSPPVADDVPGLDYESITLMRLRQAAERARLERKIREQDAAN